MFFEAKNLSKRNPNGKWLFRNLNISLNEGDIVVVSGPSGSGKTTLLRCLAELTSFDTGTLKLRSQDPDTLSIPCWRSRVLYVPQRPPALSGTPLEFYNTTIKYVSQKKRNNFADPIKIAAEWNFPENLWHQEWNTLSGGEMQRAALAIAVAMKSDILLLDEPTSALDPETTLLVEKTLTTRSCIWITHSPEQDHRVATKRVELGHMNYTEDNDTGYAVEEIILDG